MVFESRQDNRCSAFPDTLLDIIHDLMVPILALAEQLIGSMDFQFLLREIHHTRKSRPYQKINPLFQRVLLRRVLAADRSQHHVVDLFQFVAADGCGRYTVDILRLDSAKYLLRLRGCRVTALVHDDKTISVNLRKYLTFSIDGADHGDIHNAGCFVRASPVGANHILASLRSAGLGTSAQAPIPRKEYTSYIAARLLNQPAYHVRVEFPFLFVTYHLYHINTIAPQPLL